MTYPYPGDEPTALSSLSVDLDCAQVDMTTFTSTLAEISGQLTDAWQGEVASKATADLSTVQKGLPEITKRLGYAKAAVDTYRGVIVTVRGEVDDLRRRHATLVTALNGERDQYARSGRFADANDMAPAELAAYRQTIITAENELSGQLGSLDEEYRAQVSKSDRAALTCQAALTASVSSTSYQGSTLTAIGIDQLLGLERLKAAHWARMVAEAKQFEAAINHINDSNLDPVERNRQIQALLDKYGLAASDPDFAMTVANDQGPDFFTRFLTKTGEYDCSHPVDPDLEKRLLQLSATILATATDQTKPVHVDQNWIDDFFTDDRGYVRPDAVMAGSDYLRLGIRFQTAFLDGVGTNALRYEAQFANNLDANGRPPNPWVNIGQGLFYPGGPPAGTDFWGNDDPLTSVMRQYADHPDAHSILFQDQTPDGNESDRLYALTHRAWGSGGADALGDAIVAETGPNAGDPAAAGSIAQHYLHDVTQNQKSEPGYAGVPSELHDATGTVIARYLSSVMNQMSDTGGLPGSGDALLYSGLGGEGPVANITIDRDDLTAALKFAYSDTDDAGVRTVLSDAWSRVSAHDLSLAYAEATDQYAGNGPYPYNPNIVLNTAGASSKLLGLLTHSDISGFDSAVDQQVELAAQKKHMLETLESLIPIPDLPAGTPAFAGNVLDVGIDTVKDLINTHLVPDVDTGVKGDHANEAGWQALSQVDAYPKSIITHLSASGLPIVYDPSSPGDVTAVVPVAQDPNHLFTTADGHLKPIADIARSQAASDAFNSWYARVGFTSGNASGEQIHVTIHDPYDEGYQLASN